MDQVDHLDGNRHLKEDHRKEDHLKEDHLQDLRVDGTHHLHLGVHKAAGHLMECPHRSLMHHHHHPLVVHQADHQVDHLAHSHQPEELLGVGAEGLCQFHHRPDSHPLHLDWHPLLRAHQITGAADTGAGTKAHPLHQVDKLALV